LAACVRPHRSAFVLVVGLLLLIALAGAATPLIVSRSVDVLGGNLTPLSIGLLSGAILLAGVVSWGANWLRRRLTVRMVGDIVLALRDDAFRAAVDHDLSFYDQYSSGRIVSRITPVNQEFGQMVVLIPDLM